MNKDIVNRVIKEGNYLLQTDKTIRELAKVFNVSKSTVHKDLKERLIEIDIDLYKKVSKILQDHISIRHIRGGESTKRKFLQKKLT